MSVGFLRGSACLPPSGAVLSRKQHCAELAVRACGVRRWGFSCAGDRGELHIKGAGTRRWELGGGVHAHSLRFTSQMSLLPHLVIQLFISIFVLLFFLFGQRARNLVPALAPAEAHGERVAGTRSCVALQALPGLGSPFLGLPESTSLTHLAGEGHSVPGASGTARSPSGGHAWTRAPGPRRGLSPAPLPEAFPPLPDVSRHRNDLGWTPRPLRGSRREASNPDTRECHSRWR